MQRAGAWGPEAASPPRTGRVAVTWGRAHGGHSRSVAAGEGQGPCSGRCTWPLGAEAVRGQSCSSFLRLSLSVGPGRRLGLCEAGLLPRPDPRLTPLVNEPQDLG